MKQGKGTSGASPEAEAGARPQPMGHPCRWIFAGALGFFLLFAGGRLYTGDARTNQATARSLLSGRGLAIPFDRGYGGSFAADGKFYGQYGAGAVAVAVPLVLIGDRVAGASGTIAGRLAADLPLSLVNTVFSAGTVTLVALVLMRLGYRRRVVLAAAAIGATATMLWPYAGRDFSEPQIAFWLMLALERSLRLDPARRGPAIACGAALGAAVLTKIYSAILVPFFVVFAWLEGGRKPATVAALLAPVGLAVMAIAGYNQARFGDLLTTGYSSEVQGAHVPLAIGLFGLLLSAGKSFFLFDPPALLALGAAGAFHRRHARLSSFVWVLVAVHLVFFGIQQNWDGDWCWGPRYLLPLCPLLLVVAAPFLEGVLSGTGNRARQAAFWLVVLAGTAVQFLGTVVNPNDYVLYLTDRKGQLGDYLPQYPDKTYIPFHAHHWNPDLSPLRGHLFLLGATLSGEEVPPTTRPAAESRAPAPSSEFVLYSTAEEWNDERGHRLLPLVDLGPAGKHAGNLDFWFVTMPSLLEPRAKVLLLLPLALVSLGTMALALPRLARIWRLAARAEPAATAGNGPEESVQA